jgi:hypothetical protein
MTLFTRVGNLELPFGLQISGNWAVIVQCSLVDTRGHNIMKEILIDRTYSRKTDDHEKSNMHDDISARKMMFIEGNNKGRQALASQGDPLSPLLQKRFLVLARNTFLLAASVPDTNCTIKKIKHILCWPEWTDTKN